MVSIDQSLCSGCGICVDACPEVFVWGADGKATVLKQEDETGRLEEIADQCPTDAIQL
jgi:ferredoxin